MKCGQSTQNCKMHESSREQNVPVFQAEIKGQRYVIDTPTGDYMRVAVIASAMADASLPCHVKLWSDAVLPDYGPYWYTVATDIYGRLKCGPQMGDCHDETS